MEPKLCSLKSGIAPYIEKAFDFSSLLGAMSISGWASGSSLRHGFPCMRSHTHTYYRVQDNQLSLYINPSKNRILRMSDRKKAMFLYTLQNLDSGKAQVCHTEQSAGNSANIDFLESNACKST